MAASLLSPEYGPEFTLIPYSVNGSTGAAGVGALALKFPSALSWSLAAEELGSPGTTTTGTGSPNFVANSKSLSSCAGTAIIAPVPYSINTKFPTQMGIFSPLNGLIAYRPVKN